MMIKINKTEQTNRVKSVFFCNKCEHVTKKEERRVGQSWGMVFLRDGGSRLFYSRGRSWWVYFLRDGGSRLIDSRGQNWWMVLGEGTTKLGLRNYLAYFYYTINV